MNNPNCMIIAEVGNCHEGNLEAALEMMNKAEAAGASLVKFQAGKAEGFARNPLDKAEVDRYRKYELGVMGYNRLIEEGRRIGIGVFFSVWSPEFEYLHDCEWRKIPARQCKPDVIRRLDSPKTLISIPHTMFLPHVSELGIVQGIPLHVVAAYPAGSGMLGRAVQVLHELRKPIGSIGYSDHTIGIYWPVRLATDPALRCRVVEKHFTLKHDFGPLRDHQHAATPEEFAEMADRIRR